MSADCDDDSDSDCKNTFSELIMNERRQSTTEPNRAL